MFLSRRTIHNKNVGPEKAHEIYLVPNICLFTLTFFTLFEVVMRYVMFLPPTMTLPLHGNKRKEKKTILENGVLCRRRDEIT